MRRQMGFECPARRNTGSPERPPVAPQNHSSFGGGASVDSGTRRVETLKATLDRLPLGPKLCLGPNIPEALLRRMPDSPII